MKETSFVQTYFNFSQLDPEKFWTATKETLLMTGVSMVFVIVIGILLGLILFFLGKSKKKGAKQAYSVLSLVSNVFRSIPFIILLILLFPFSKWLLNTMLGAKAAIPALIISAAPFYARLVEIAFREVDAGVLEASEAMGATRFQLIRKVLIPESVPALLSGATVTTITMIGFTAMAGAIGSGGLGSLAYQGGYMSRKPTIILFATVVILLIVFIVQGIGDFAVKKTDKR